MFDFHMLRIVRISFDYGTSLKAPFLKQIKRLILDPESYKSSDLCQEHRKEEKMYYFFSSVFQFALTFYWKEYSILSLIFTTRIKFELSGSVKDELEHDR